MIYLCRCRVTRIPVSLGGEGAFYEQQCLGSISSVTSGVSCVYLSLIYSLKGRGPLIFPFSPGAITPETLIMVKSSFKSLSQISECILKECATYLRDGLSSHRLIFHRCGMLFFGLCSNSTPQHRPLPFPSLPFTCLSPG